MNIPPISVSLSAASDPVTAVGNCIANIAAFYCTPAGQKLAETQMQGAQKFDEGLQAIFGRVEQFFATLA